MAHSRARRVSSKPANWRKAWGLSPHFPLFPLGPADEPHKLRWAKKVRGKLHYFGKVEGDPKGVKALDAWNRDKDELIAGRVPRTKLGGLTLADLCNRWLSSKRTDVESGKLSPVTFVQYSTTTDVLIEVFGRDRAVADLRPDDFERLYAKLAGKHGLSTLGREVTKVRSVFKYAMESDLIDRVVKFGPRFRGPSKADKRKHKARLRHQHGGKVFTPEELRAILKAAPTQLKAMILLGVNCGLGNTDCARLPLSAINLTTGWLDYPRPKTGIERRCPLWPETVQAIREVIKCRPAAKDEGHKGLLFLTRCAQPWVRYELLETKSESGKVSVAGRGDDAIAKATAKLLTALKLKRPGLSFYGLRHTTETIGGARGDQVAVDAIMGHVDASMAAEYREHIDNARLLAVVEHVHSWLFGEGVGNG